MNKISKDLNLKWVFDGIVYGSILLVSSAMPLHQPQVRLLGSLFNKKIIFLRIKIEGQDGHETVLHLLWDYVNWWNNRMG